MIGHYIEKCSHRQLQLAHLPPLHSPSPSPPPLPCLAIYTHGNVPKFLRPSFKINCFHALNITTVHYNPHAMTDNAFVSTIGGLLWVKVLQNRHPDIHTNAFVAFFLFAVVIFCISYGIVSVRPETWRG